MQANQDIRKAIVEAELKQWQVAEALGKADCTFCIWLRRELSPEKKKLVFEAIEKAKETNAVSLQTAR